MRLLHGTSERDWLIIQQSGGIRDPYLTTLETVASFFADEAADSARSLPIILEVTVDDETRLEADLPMFQEPIFEVTDEMGYPSVYAYHQAMKEGGVPWPKDSKDWKTSLAVVKSVRYRGVIPPEKIKVYEPPKRSGILGSMKLGERTVSETYHFAGKPYVVGKSYSFNELPKLVRKDVLSQDEDIEAHFGKSARTVSYRLVMVPNQELVRMLQERFGEKGYSKRLHDPDLIAFARRIEQEGLQQPPAVDEGWRRAFALAYLGWDMPYFMVDETIEMPGPTFIPTLEGLRLGATLYRYALMYRPPSFATLPPGWTLVERPQIPGWERREDLPVSSHRFGVVTYERPLTDDEIASYQLEVL